jgi:hypothetical protein
MSTATHLHEVIVPEPAPRKGRLRIAVDRSRRHDGLPAAVVERDADSPDEAGGAGQATA